MTSGFCDTNIRQVADEGKFPANKRIISILPGSRKTEVSKLLPIFMESARRLLNKDPNFMFVLPTVKTVSGMVKEMTKGTDLPLLIVETQAERYGAFKASSAAIAASGTVALELAICKIPHLIAYKVSKLTAFIISKIMHIQYVNLTNIMLGRCIVPELLQEHCTAAEITANTLELLKQGSLFEREMQGFEEVKGKLSNGNQTPSQNAADIILEMIKD